jgi:hypothetical protein
VSIWFRTRWFLVVVLSLAAAAIFVSAIVLLTSDLRTAARGCTDNGKPICAPNWFLNLVLPTWIVWFCVLAALNRLRMWSVFPPADDDDDGADRT